jgi:hypothetical protein
MPSINLTEDERSLLVRLLENDLSDLRMEIADTDNMKFKQALRENKTHLSNIIEKLKNASETMSVT